MWLGNTNKIAINTITKLYTNVCLHSKMLHVDYGGIANIHTLNNMIIHKKSKIRWLYASLNRGGGEVTPAEEKSYKLSHLQ